MMNFTFRIGRWLIWSFWIISCYSDLLKNERSISFLNIWFCLKIYRCLIPLLKKWWKSYCPSVQSRRPPISVLSSVSGFCRYVAISCLWNIRLLRIYKKDSVKLKTILKCELNYHNSIFHLNKFQSKSDLIYKFYNLYGFFPVRVIESMY